MRDKNFTVNFDRLPDFEVAPNVPATKWQEQMEHESESSLLGEVIRFAIKVARLTQAATEEAHQGNHPLGCLNRRHQ